MDSMDPHSRSSINILEGSFKSYVRSLFDGFVSSSACCVRYIKVCKTNFKSQNCLVDEPIAICMHMLLSLTMACNKISIYTPLYLL